MRVSTVVVILGLAAGVAPSVALPIPAMKCASLLLHLRFSSFILLCRSRGATFSLHPDSPPLLPQSMPPPQHPGPNYPSPNPPSFVQQPRPWPPLQHPQPIYPNPPPFVHQLLPPSARPLTPSSISHTPPTTDHTPPTTDHTPPTTDRTPSSTSNTPPTTYHTPSSSISHTPPTTDRTPSSTSNTPPTTYHAPRDTPHTPRDIPPSQCQSSSPLSLERELLERVDQRIQLAARAYVRELLTAPMNNLD